MNSPTTQDVFEKRKDLAYYSQLFRSLPAPVPDQLNADFRAEFVGPAWLRITAPYALSLSGFRGWWGKRLRPGGPYVNLAQRDGQMTEIRPMLIQTANSALDGQPSVILSYPEDGGWPWSKVRDELRLVEEGLLLGMTVANLPFVRTRPFPFLLLAEELSTNSQP